MVIRGRRTLMFESRETENFFSQDQNQTWFESERGGVINWGKKGRVQAGEKIISKKSFLHGGEKGKE